jgi:hypothetical protein
MADVGKYGRSGDLVVVGKNVDGSWKASVVPRLRVILFPVGKLGVNRRDGNIFPGLTGGRVGFVPNDPLRVP